MSDDPPGTRDLRGNPLPTPDPTKVTTEQIDKAVNNLQALMRAEVLGLERILDEKFVSVGTRLDLGEAQRIEQKVDTKTAVDAALSAAKEAVREQTAAFALATAKSEAGTAEQLKQLNVTFTAAIDNLTGTLNEVKERVGRIENVKIGGQESKDRSGALVGIVAAVVGTLVGLAGIAFAIAAAAGQ